VQIYPVAVIEIVPVPEPAELVIVTVYVVGPDTPAGVPLIMHVEVLSDNPEGSAGETLHVTFAPPL